MERFKKICGIFFALFITLFSLDSFAITCGVNAKASGSSCVCTNNSSMSLLTNGQDCVPSGLKSSFDQFINVCSQGTGNTVTPRVTAYRSPNGSDNIIGYRVICENAISLQSPLYSACTNTDGVYNNKSPYCAACNTSAFLDTAAGVCRPNCSSIANSTLNQSTNACECKSGYTMFADTCYPAITLNANGGTLSSDVNALYYRTTTPVGLYTDPSVITSKISNATCATSCVSVSAPTRAGYTFEGWYSGDCQVLGKTGRLSGNSCVSSLDLATITELVAKWTYTVTFKSGNATLGTQTFTYGTDQNLKAVASMSNIPVSSTHGWAFAGWATSVKSTTVAYTDEQSVSISGNTTLYGVWARPVTFTYYNGASATSTTTPYPPRTQYYYNTSTTTAAAGRVLTYALTEEHDNGWIAKGWTSTKDNATYFIEIEEIPSKNIELAISAPNQYYAVYHRNATLAYVGGDGAEGSTANTTKTQSFRAGNTEADTLTMTLPDNGFTRTGYSFNKWAAGSASGDEFAVDASYTFPNKTWTSGNTAHMYATWNLVTYNITYNLNGGNNYNGAPTSYNITTATITLGTPTRANSTFGGWYAESSFTNKVTQIAQGSTGNKTFYAKWTCNSGYYADGNTCKARTYTITLNNGGGTGATTLYVKYNVGLFTDTEQENKVLTDTQAAAGCTGICTAVTIPTKEGGHFSGYYTSDGIQVLNENGYVVAANANALYKITANTTLYAQYEPNVSGLITLDSMYYSSSTASGTAVTKAAKPAYLVVTYGDRVEGCNQADCSDKTSLVDKINSIPEYTGYTFGGFYTDKTGTGTKLINSDGTFIDAIKTTYKEADETDTLYAKWTGNKITLKWANGGRGTAPTTPASCTYGSTFTMPAAMTATGYTFSKWSVNGKTFDAGASVTCNYTNLGKYSGEVTITGTWTNNVHTVTLDDATNGGSGGSGKVYQKYATGWSLTNFGTTITKVTVPTKTNSVFTGYYTAASGGTRRISADGTLPANTSYTSKGSTTLNAQFESCSCTKGSNVSDCSVTGVSGNKCTYSYTCANGYQTSGTFTGSAATGENTSPNCTPKVLTITLDDNGGSGGSGKVYQKYATGWSLTNFGTTISSVAIPTRAGYVFNGYYQDSTRRITNAGGLPANTTFTSNVTLKASWTAASCTKGTGVSNANPTVSGNAVTCEVTCSTGYSKEGGYVASPTTTFSVSGSAGTATVETACTRATYKVTLNNQSATTAGTTAYYYQYNLKGNCYYYTDSALTTCIGGTSGSTITAPTKTNNIFGGYYTSTGGSGTQYILHTGVTTGSLYANNAKDMTLYAKWTTPSCSATNGTATLKSVTGNKPVCTITCSTGYSQSGGTNRTTSFDVTGTAGATSAKDSCYAQCNLITLDNEANGGEGGTTALYKLTNSTAWYTANTCSGTAITTLPTKPTKTNAEYTGHFD